MIVLRGYFVEDSDMAGRTQKAGVWVGIIPWGEGGLGRGDLTAEPISNLKIR
jgi:hypothetical protein